MIRYCLFDVFGTLFYSDRLFQGTSQRLTGLVPSLTADDLKKELQSLYNQVFERIFDRSNPFVSEYDLYLEVYRLLQEKFKLKLDVPAWMDLMYDDFALTSVYPDTHETLSRLRAMGMQITLLSNIDEQPLRKLLNHFPDLSYDHVVSSEKARCYKPHQGVFMHALSLMDARPDQTVMIGDNYRADIKGAKAMGMKTVWIDRYQRSLPLSSDHPEADARIIQLDQIFPLLEQWS